MSANPVLEQIRRRLAEIARRENEYVEGGDCPHCGSDYAVEGYQKYYCEALHPYWRCRACGEEWRSRSDE